MLVSFFFRRFLQLSDMVAIVPRRLALWAAAHASLVLLDPPYPAVAVEIETLWNQASDEDHTIPWLLNELAASVGNLELFLVHLRIGLAF